MGEPSDGGLGRTPEINNTAQDNSQVDAQIGVVEGDAVFHRHETIYQVAPDDTAEQKYRVARNNLDGGIPRVAEDLLGQALDAGLATTEVAYYYALSVLGERSVNQLGPVEVDKLFRARSIAARFESDDWTAALKVVMGLVQCAMPLGETANVSPDDLQVVLGAFQAIAQPRRAEISRHLDMIRNGAIQDEFDRLNAKTIEADRVRDNRTDRAWKYFHPDPTKPRLAAPVPVEQGRVVSVAWGHAVVGSAGLVATLALGTWMFDNAGFLVLPSSVFLLGVAVTVWFGSLVVVSSIHRRMNDHAEIPDPLDKSSDSYKALPESYKAADEIARRINYYFSPRYIYLRYFQFTELSFANKDQWIADTGKVRAALYARLVRLYAASRVPTATINWLVRWHAKHTFERWRANASADLGETGRSAVSTILLLCVGALTVSTGAVLLVAAAVSQGAFQVVVALLVIATGCVGGLGIATVLGHHRAMLSERIELDRLFAGELHEYNRWCERLRDRPSDAEMAAWLDNDKSYLKTRAMQQCGLSNRDIIAHIVLTQGKPFAKRARIANGPPRFSKYVVLIFLLTENGVRGVTFDLDFETAAIYDQRRTSFGYDALASVNVTEKGFLSGENGQRHVVRRGPEIHLTDQKSLVLRRELQLSLVNQQDIVVIVDYDGLLDETADEEQPELDGLALDSSGVTGALHVLEAVAAEGRKWITWERDLRNRRWQDWEHGRTSRGELTDRGHPPLIEQSPERQQNVADHPPST